jgi:uncharacterized protein YaeQ
MALSATTFHLKLALSDVDRGVYQALDLRLARHPSETMRYMLTRTLAYALHSADGIEFSKGGLSVSDEPAITIRDLTGLLQLWVEIGAPSAERLHRASKAAPKVVLYTYGDVTLLRKEFASRAIHKLCDIEVYRVEPAFLDALAARIDRNTSLELTRSDEHLYVSVGGDTLDAKLERLTFETA